MAQSSADLKTEAFKTPLEFQRWLAEHHPTSPGIWMAIARKRPGAETLSYSDALDIALCYGWIDGQKKPGDTDAWFQKFTPRRPRSRWSKLNVQRAERLIASGRMRAAGRRAVDAAKADGRWARAYDSPGAMVLPEDFLAEAAKVPAAAAVVKTLDRRNIYAIAYRLQDAKRPETRAKRMREFLDLLAQGRRPFA